MPKLSRPIQYVPKSTLEGLGGASDHGGLTGLGDDDHTQYHNDTRGDARYYTQALLDAGQLDTRYYTETESDANYLPLTGGNWKTLYTNGSGVYTELTLGTSGDVLTSNGATSAPSWQTPSGGGLTYAQDDTDHFEALYTTNVAFETDSLGIVVNGVGADTQPRINFLDGDGGTQVGNIRATSTGFVIDNRRVSGHILLRAKNSASSVVNTFLGDPDAESSMYYNGSIALSTISGSIKFGTHTGIGAETVTGYITVQDSGGTSRKIAVVS